MALAYGPWLSAKKSPTPLGSSRSYASCDAAAASGDDEFARLCRDKEARAEMKRYCGWIFTGVSTGAGVAAFVWAAPIAGVACVSSAVSLGKTLWYGENPSVTKMVKDAAVGGACGAAAALAAPAIGRVAGGSVGGAWGSIFGGFVGGAVGTVVPRAVSDGVDASISTGKLGKHVQQYVPDTRKSEDVYTMQNLTDLARSAVCGGAITACITSVVMLAYHISAQVSAV